MFGEVLNKWELPILSPEETGGLLLDNGGNLIMDPV